jgi:hypothetical protein
VASRRVTTFSGRQYILMGEPANTREVLLCMFVMLLSRGECFNDVTQEVLEAASDGRGSWHLH